MSSSIFLWLRPHRRHLRLELSNAFLGIGGGLLVGEFVSEGGPGMGRGLVRYAFSSNIIC